MQEGNIRNKEVITHPKKKNTSNKQGDDKSGK